jgi:hypothetical protein
MSKMVSFRRKKGEKFIKMKVTPAESDLKKIVEEIKNQLK